MISINTNISSFIARQSLDKATDILNTAVERMSTGYKINSGKDNAANYNITTNMTTYIQAYQIAEDNASMGIDLINTATSSLELLGSQFSRLRTLATQAANGTYGEASLQAINSEANAIVEEIKRVFQSTEYNGISLFGPLTDSSFVNEVTQRETESMTKFSGVSDSSTISSGIYSISTAAELEKLADMTNRGLIQGGEFVLADDIDLASYTSNGGWVPIGTSTNSFEGTFDGNGYTISNLYINRSGSSNQGFLGQSGSNAVIKNLALESVDITARSSSGSIVGVLDGSTISNCYSSGRVTGTNNTGGIAGATTLGSIIDTYTTAAVAGSAQVGGIAGDSIFTTFNNVYAINSVSGTGNNIGGIAGYAGGNLTNCYVLGDTSGLDGIFAGLADSTISISDCFYYENNGLPYVGSGTPNIGNISYFNPNDLPFNVGGLDNVIVQFQIGIFSDEASQISVNTTMQLNSIDDLKNIGIGTSDYLGKIDKFTALVSAKETELGAISNRLESAIEEIGIRYDNLVSSRSTLRDADIAEVSSEYIKQQILQQASATLLATANQTPSIALQLL